MSDKSSEPEELPQTSDPGPATEEGPPTPTAEASEVPAEETATDDAAESSPTADPQEEQGAAEQGEEPSASEGSAPSPQPAGHSVGEVLIEAEGLCKYYGSFAAIKNVSFEVRRGQVVAFLGPNGAGKSTTMRILTGVSAPDLGEARICGLSVIHCRLDIAHRLGYLPENGPLYDEMTPRGLLTFFGEARGLNPDRLHQRLEELRERLALGHVMDKPIHKLSKGFRQRVGLAQALLHEPEVLIMDEPTSGLDPNQIRDVRRIIREFGQDKAILLSTHILQEVEAVADRVVFIDRGQIVFKGSVEELRASVPARDLQSAFATHTKQAASSWAS